MAQVLEPEPEHEVLVGGADATAANMTLLRPAHCARLRAQLSTLEPWRSAPAIRVVRVRGRWRAPRGAGCAQGVHAVAEVRASRAADYGGDARSVAEGTCCAHIHTNMEFKHASTGF